MDALRRLLLAAGYRLPPLLQRPFHRFLYDDSPRRAGRLEVTADDADEPVCFEFVGGCRDGERLKGPLANPFYWESDHGRIGTRFKVASEAAVDAVLQGARCGLVLKHEYEIVENQVENGIRHIRAEARVS